MAENNNQPSRALTLTQQIHAQLIREGKMPQHAAEPTITSLVPGHRNLSGRQVGPAKPWQGMLLKKPWQYEATAVIPHLNTPEHLELCIGLLQSQTVKPYIMVIDTGSDSSVFARVVQLRTDNVEVHQIAHHGIQDEVDAVCSAMDLGMSLCRTEYLWCLHSDCFVVNREMLAELLRRAQDGKRPVIGYQSVPREGSLEWQGMVSHTCTLLHMPTMHKIDASWSKKRLEARANQEGRSVILDTEMMLNYRLREHGIKPYILGAETKYGVESDRNRVHLRSATAKEMLGTNELERQPVDHTAALKSVIEVARECGVDTSGIQAIEGGSNRPSVFNLIYHVAPFANSNVWRKNVQEIVSRASVFNGKRIVAIATGQGMASATEVKREFGRMRAEFIEIPNDDRLREAASFLTLLDSVYSLHPFEATFYAHAKGVTKPENSAAFSWAKCMYREMLDDMPRIVDALSDHPAAGVSYRMETSWLYPGSFYWFRNDALFSKPNWRTLGNETTKEGLGWSVEAYPNRMFFEDGYRIYPKFKYWGPDAGPLYDQAWWSDNTPESNAEEFPPTAEPPHYKFAVQHFGDQWISKLPAPGIECGRDELFDDERIQWFIERSGDLTGKRILELGSLEGGHTYQLDAAGAEVLGIEANMDSYLRSLVVKEVLDMKRARFLPGDFIAHLRECERVGKQCERVGKQYDAVVAVGVLYHMTEPLELLRLISKATDTLFLWSHYYDKDLIAACQCAQQWFWGGLAVQESGGVRCMGYRHDYGERPKQSHHIGGTTPYSFWIPRDAILNALKTFGFDSVEICFDEPSHKHGPAFACLAQRT